MAPEPEPVAHRSSEDPALSRSVVERLAAEAGPDGFVPFDRFMEIALYAERIGYYARERSPFGPDGDFYTAAHAHPLFARAVAERVRTVLEPRRPKGPVAIVEIGAGDGRLAEGVLRGLAGAKLGPGVEYRLIERSPTLARRALERAGPAGEAAGIRVRGSPSVGADGTFAGFVLANELFDAQPTRRLRWTGAAWEELGVRVADGSLRPASTPLRDPVPGASLQSPDEPGAILEISAAGEAILREVADHLTDGEFLILDYGMGQAELLAAHPRGTLEAVRRHRPVADPLSEPGASDLSVFVNFDRLRSAARAAGWQEISFTSQAEALGRWGFPELLASALREARSAEEEVRLRLAAKNLVFGFDRFRALELGLPAPGAPATGPADLRT